MPESFNVINEVFSFNEYLCQRVGVSLRKNNEKNKFTQNLNNKHLQCKINHYLKLEIMLSSILKLTTKALRLKKLIAYHSDCKEKT